MNFNNTAVPFRALFKDNPRIHYEVVSLPSPDPLPPPALTQFYTQKKKVKKRVRFSDKVDVVRDQRHHQDE